MKQYEPTIDQQAIEQLRKLVHELDRTALQLSRTMDQACHAFESLGLSNNPPLQFDELHLDLF